MGDCYAIFMCLINVCMLLAYTYQVSSKSNHPGAVLMSYRFLKMAAMVSQVVFRLRV